jgi:hypothetical protein
MILMWATSIFEGHGKGPENRDFLGPEMATSEASECHWAQKSRDFQDPPLPMA